MRQVILSVMIAAGASASASTGTATGRGAGDHNGADLVDADAAAAASMSERRVADAAAHTLTLDELVRVRIAPHVVARLNLRELESARTDEQRGEYGSVDGVRHERVRHVVLLARVSHHVVHDAHERFVEQSETDPQELVARGAFVECRRVEVCLTLVYAS